MLTNESQYETEWWRTAFDKEWLQAFAYKTKDAPREARAICTMLALPTHSKILDLGCGDGRIAVWLARLGFNITGLDLSTPMLEAARKKAERSNLSICWTQMDMRDIGFSDEFDAIINISTSFGYFAYEENNIRTLHSAAHALRKGGKLLLDLENVYNLSQMSRTYGTGPSYQPVNQFRGWLEESTFFDPISHTIQMSLRFWRNERLIKEVGARYRVYSFLEISQMLESCGFRIRKVFGDFQLRPYNVDSVRMIVLSEKS